MALGSPDLPPSAISAGTPYDRVRVAWWFVHVRTCRASAKTGNYRQLFSFHTAILDCFRYLGAVDGNKTLRTCRFTLSDRHRERKHLLDIRYGFLRGILGGRGMRAICVPHRVWGPFMRRLQAIPKLITIPRI